MGERSEDLPRDCVGRVAMGATPLRPDDARPMLRSVQLGQACERS